MMRLSRSVTLSTADESESKESSTLAGVATSTATPMSISTYMADASTRVVDYNGRKLVSILGTERFFGERVVRLPSKAVEFASRQPITSALLPCRVGYYPHARGQKVSRPSGDWSHTLLLCMEGAGWLDQREKRYRMVRGSLALLRPFEFHSYEADPEDPWSLYWVHFNGRMAQEYHDALTSSGLRTCLPIQVDVKLIQSFERILNAFADGYAYRMLVQASTALHQLFGEIHGLIHHCEELSEGIDTRIERTMRVMRENPDSNISIHEFAAAAHTSKMYFASKFRKITGETPRNYFSKVKMAKACSLLVGTKIKVESVAQMVGYKDAFYFSRAFKRIIGQTPSQYRMGHTAPSAVSRL